MERVKHVYHGAKQIVFLDFSGCRIQDLPVIMDKAEKLIRSEPLNSVLTLTDVSGARYNIETSAALKEFVKGNKPFVKAGAVVGLDALKKIIFNGVMYFSGRSLAAFDDMDAAKDWLVRQ